MKKYIKPKIYEKKVKLNFFLTPIGFLDELKVGQLYAQSGCSTTGTSGSSATGPTGSF